MAEPEFEQIVNAHYEPLYRFALSLTGREAESCDLAQQTFYLWAAKGHQLRDKSKVKTWLFTTLHREFLGARRHAVRFPHQEIDTVESELPAVSPATLSEVDAAVLMEKLLAVDELFRAPLMLFYLEEHSYRDIAEILDVPIGTVMSRLARGKAQLRRLLSEPAAPSEAKIVPMDRNSTAKPMP